MISQKITSAEKVETFCQNVSMEKQHDKNNSEKFKNKYRVKSARLPDHDYSQNGAYFITICTKNREHFFGEIKNGKMELSEIGKIVAEEWKKTAEIRENITLGDWVIMPNHFHGILIVDNNEKDVLAKRLYHGEYPEMSEISPTKNSISTAIRFFKRQTTIQSRKISPDFSWQSRFHDHVIRNEEDLANISEYIQYNPQKWEDDCYFKT